MHTRSNRGVDQDSVVVGAMHKMNQQFRFLLSSIAGRECRPFSHTTVLLTSIAGSKCRPFSHTTVLPPH
jgi:hypothetical protein